MDAVLDLLSSLPGPAAFLLLLSCGVGGPPWSEEIVLLGMGYFVAEGHLSLEIAVLWGWGGILVGDSFLFFLGKTVGERVYEWPILRKKMGLKQRAQFNRSFRRNGTKAVFLARFLPGYRLVAYFVAGNLGMRYWKFVLLDTIGAILTVPISIWIGSLFAENLDQAMALIRGFEIPLAIAAGLVLAGTLWYSKRRRRQKLEDLLRQRAEHQDSKAPPSE